MKTGLAAAEPSWGPGSRPSTQARRRATSCSPPPSTWTTSTRALGAASLQVGLVAVNSVFLSFLSSIHIIEVINKKNSCGHFRKVLSPTPPPVTEKLVLGDNFTKSMFFFSPFLDAYKNGLKQNFSSFHKRMLALISRGESNLNGCLFRSCLFPQCKDPS